MHDATRATQSKSTRSAIVSRIRLLKSAPDLSPSHRLVLRSLVDYFGQRDECWPSVSTLATECGLSVRHCRRLLRDLERSGWITHRPRFRPDGSQTSSLIEWAYSPRTPMSAPPDTDVRPIEAFRENPTEQHAECGFSDVAEPEATNAPPVPRPEATAVSAAAAIQPETTPEATNAPPVPQPEAKARRPSPRWIEIQNSTFSDPAQAARVYAMAVAGGLITPSDADRLAFFAAWCAVSRKARAGNASNPGGMMRFLLSNPKALRAYPTAPDEAKAREAVRRLFLPSSPAAAVSACNPFRPVD